MDSMITAFSWSFHFHIHFKYSFTKLWWNDKIEQETFISNPCSENYYKKSRSCKTCCYYDCIVRGCKGRVRIDFGSSIIFTIKYHEKHDPDELENHFKLCQFIYLSFHLKITICSILNDILGINCHDNRSTLYFMHSIFSLLLELTHFLAGVCIYRHHRTAGSVFIDGTHYFRIIYPVPITAFMTAKSTKFHTVFNELKNFEIKNPKVNTKKKTIINATN